MAQQATRENEREVSARTVRTRRKLLDAATTLFAERGYRAVSVRDIADAARVNSALVAYHFESKAGLFEEVIRVATEAHVAARLEALGAAAGQGRPIAPERLVGLYLLPLFGRDIGDGGESAFSRLHSVMVSERQDVFERIAARAFNELNVRFVEEASRSLPYLSRETIIWRLYAMIGACLFLETKPAPPGMRTLSRRRIRPGDPSEFVRQMTSFLAAGLTAAEPKSRDDPTV